MPPLGSLGTFLILSFLLPGIIIFSALILLFPEAYVIVEKRSATELIALVLVISFLNGHLPFLYEIHALNYVWDRLFPKLHLLNRSKIMHDRSKILASAEVNGFSHQHFDTVFGEFILYTNSSLWVFIISFAKLCLSRTTADLFESTLAVISCFVILTFTSPFFKHQYICALEAIRESNELRLLLSQSSQTSTTGSKQQDEKSEREQGSAHEEVEDVAKSPSHLEDHHDAFHA